MELEHGEITEQIIGAAFEVYAILGYGFLEKVYQRAMQVELRLRGLKAEIEDKINVRYKDELVGQLSGGRLGREQRHRRAQGRPGLSVGG
jgi:PD-(D/E)XK nuclease superfamily